MNDGRKHRIAIIGALLMLVGLCLAPMISAQQRSASNNADAWARYNAEKKDEIVAAALEWVVPVVGHAYAGDVHRGLIPLAVSGGGLVLTVIGLSAQSCDYYDAYCGPNGALVGIGLLTYLGGRVWGVVSAYGAAQDFNAALRQRLNLSAQLGREPGSVELTVGIPISSAREPVR